MAEQKGVHGLKNHSRSRSSSHSPPRHASKKSTREAGSRDRRSRSPGRRSRSPRPSKPWVWEFTGKCLVNGGAWSQWIFAFRDVCLLIFPNVFVTSFTSFFFPPQCKAQAPGTTYLYMWNLWNEFTIKSDVSLCLCFSSASALCSLRFGL